MNFLLHYIRVKTLDLEIGLHLLCAADLIYSVSDKISFSLFQSGLGPEVKAIKMQISLTA